MKNEMNKEKITDNNMKKSTDKFTAVRKLTDNRFLNLYEMDALTVSGAPFHYYFASRNKKEELPLNTGLTRSNGIVIYPVWKKEPDKIVLIRQYRYPINRWLYELPAGLIDEGETSEQAAIREMKEETGLDFEPYTGGDTVFRRPVYLGAGMTDETSTSVFGYAVGDISKGFQEDSERIEVLLANKTEVRRILREEDVSLRAAFLLMNFLQMNKENPFGFLE